MIKNKEISNIWLNITNQCNFVCSYCYKKKNEQIMPWSVLQKSIDWCLQSPGEKKKISFCGGEPLLEIVNIKKVTEYISNKYGSLMDKPEILIISNGTLLNQDIIEFLAVNKIKFVLSIDGTRDSFRKNRTGSYDLVEKNARLLLTNLNSYSLCGQIVVCPNTVASLFENFKYLAKLGFVNINIDPVQGIYWPDEAVALFTEQIGQILKFIYRNISINKFISLNNLTRKILKQNSGENFCPFYSKLYVSPNGDLYFCSILMEDGEKFKIGNILEDQVSAKYEHCQYLDSSAVCQQCLHQYCQDFCHKNNYLNQQHYQENKKVFEIYQLILDQANNKILKLKKFLPAYLEFIDNNNF